MPPVRSISMSSMPARRLLTKLQKLPEHAPLLARLGFARYKIFLKVIPVVCISIAVRAILEATIDSFDGLISSSSVTPFAASSMFVIALMLAGVLEDYKEAERIPANVSNIFDSLSEKIEFCAMVTRRKRAAADKKKAQEEAAAAAAHHTTGKEGQQQQHHHHEKEEEEEIEVLDSMHLHKELLGFLTNFFEFLANLRTEQDMLAISTTYCKWFGSKIDDTAETTHVEIWEITDLFNDLRENVSRMAVIKRTNFIPSGYSLMQVLVYATVVLTSLAKYDDGGPDVPSGGGDGATRHMLGDLSNVTSWFTANLAVYCNVATYCFLFVYVLSLIDDLEDPFEYSIYSLVPNLDATDGNITMHSSGSADVDVFPLLELYARVASLAGRTDIVGVNGGVRSRYNLDVNDPLEELPNPSELIHSIDAQDMDEQTMNKRDHYRELLQDAMYTALRSSPYGKLGSGGTFSTAAASGSGRGSSRQLSKRNGSVNGGDSFTAPLIDQ